MVALRNSGHLGRIGDWAEMAAHAGKVSLHFVNTSGGGILVAPFGGSQRRLSANPIAAGVPVKEGPPIILDISTCTIAEGKIKVAFNKGEKVPDGCILDGAGHPTNDPKAFYAAPAGAILPFGGHKGYSLSVIAEVLAGALTGGSCSHFGVDRVANNMLSIIFDPAFFQSADDFAREIERLHHPRQELEDGDAGRRDPHARRARSAHPRPQAARRNRDRRHDMESDRRHGRVARRLRRVDGAMTTFFGLKVVDLAMIAGYFVVVMAIGFWSSRKVKTESDFFLGGRRFGKGLLVMHWLCTGTHSEMAVQVAGATARVGLGGIWYQWMWLFSTPFYWLMAPVTRRLRVTTTGDFFRIRYGRGPGNALRSGGPGLLRSVDRALAARGRRGHLGSDRRRRPDRAVGDRAGRFVFNVRDGRRPGGRCLYRPAPGIDDHRAVVHARARGIGCGRWPIRAARSAWARRCSRSPPRRAP